MSKPVAFDVHLNGVFMWKVYYGEDFLKRHKTLKEARLYIKRDLVDVYGYNPNIEII